MPRKIKRALVPTRHIKAFLERPRRDYRAYKKRKPVDNPGLRQADWNRLHRDQKICVSIGMRQPRFAFFNDPGTGKTLISLTLVHEWDLPVLVLVPNRANKSEWAREVAKHFPDRLSCLVLEGSSNDKWRQLEEGLQDDEADIVIETYAGLTRMACFEDKEEERLRPHKRAVDRLTAIFGGLVLDESSEVKGYNTLIFRILKRLSKNMRMVLALSGTPFGRDPTDLWSQMYLVDRGKTLGETLTLFRAAFFNAKDRYWGGVEYTFNRRKRRQLHDFLANRSIRFKLSEAEMPKVSYITRKVELSEEAADWYKRATETLYAAGEEGDTMKVKNTFLRMRQLSSGFVGFKNDEDGSRARIEFAENPKLDLLGSIASSIPRDYKVIAFHEFIYSGDRICAELERREISHSALRGGTADPTSVLRKFADPAGPQVLVLNHRAGGFGLNLQNAGYAIFYESPVSPILRRQTEARIHRSHSDYERIVIYDLMALDTFDETIREWHAQGKDLFQAILEGRINLLDLAA